MATELNFTIRKGRTCAIQIPVTGISNWTGITAKLFAHTDMDASIADIVITGTIDQPTNTITFTFIHDDTKDIDALSFLYYDVTLYKSDKSYLKDSTTGLIAIEPAVKIDPTV